MQTTNLGETLADRLTMALQSHSRVIWLVSGGGNIAIAVDAMNLLSDELTEKLVIMQADERFVAIDSSDSNWHQLLVAGFNTKRATIHPILVAGESRDQTVARYNETIEVEFSQADYIICQLGVGTDGHIAGIKPGSEASTSTALFAGYQWNDYNRVTLTFAALRRVSETLTFIYGGTKRPVIIQLTGDAPPLEQFPAGILNEINNSTVYTDQTKIERN